MTIRYLTGIVSGLAIGIVLSEALIAGADVFLIAEVSDPPGPLLLVPVYLITASFSAAMAAGMAGRSAGWLCGVLWLVPASLLASLTGMSDLVWASLAVACLTGSLIGTRLAMIIDRT